MPKQAKRGNIWGNSAIRSPKTPLLFPQRGAFMLTDPECKQARCPEGKARERLPDAGGLYLEVAPSGSKRWFVKYRFGGKERRLALGSYPGVSLKKARADRDEARKTRESGRDPVHARQAAAAERQACVATTFEGAARAHHATHASGWSQTYADKWLRLCERDLFPWIGALPVKDLNPPLLLAALRRVEARGAHDTAHALRQYAGQVFQPLVAMGYLDRNPVDGLRGQLKPLKVKHMAAVLEPAAVGRLLRDIEAYQGQPVTRAALALSALVFQRPGNVRAMEWAEIDSAAALWVIPAQKMKRKLDGKVNGRPHLVPLSTQAVAILEDLRPLTGHGRYVFPSLLSGEQCMSENTLRVALRRLGYSNDEMTPHGFRAMARTLIAERVPGVQFDTIEAQLAHVKSGPLGAAYDRAEFMEQRRQMMQAWADYLDEIKRGAEVIALQPRAA